MKLSIIIPTLNEASTCTTLFQQLLKLPFDAEIIVVDGNSNDRTQEIVKEYGFRLLLSDPGRSKQLALGAKAAVGSHLLFLHADVMLSVQNLTELERALNDRIAFASFPIQFDYHHWFLKLNALFSKIKQSYFHFGDQGLWISRKLYDQCGGYDPRTEILEDQEIYLKAAELTKPIKFKSILKVSARKYRECGAIRLQTHYYKLWLMWKLGSSNTKIAKKNHEFLATKKPSDT